MPMATDEGGSCAAADSGEHLLKSLQGGSLAVALRQTCFCTLTPKQGLTHCCGAALDFYKQGTKCVKMVLGEVCFPKNSPCETAALTMGK